MFLDEIQQPLVNLEGVAGRFQPALIEVLKRRRFPFGQITMSLKLRRDVGRRRGETE